MSRKNLFLVLAVLFVSVFMFGGTGFAWNGSYWLINGGGNYAAKAVYKYTGTGTPTDINVKSPWTNSNYVITDIQWNGSYWLIGTYEYSSAYGAMRYMAYKYDGSTVTNILAQSATNADSNNIGSDPAKVAVNGYHFKWNGSYWLINGGGNYAAKAVYKYTGTGTPTDINVKSPWTNSTYVITDIQWNGSYWLIGTYEYSSAYGAMRYMAYKYDGSTVTNILAQSATNADSNNIGSDPAKVAVNGYRFSPASMPVGTITINSNAASTNTQSVTLNMTAASDTNVVKYMKVSESSSFTGVNWENYATSKAWTLSAGDGTNKTIYIKFKDNVGFEGPTFSDTIYLDTRIPTLTSSNPADASSNVSLGSSITIKFDTAGNTYDMQASTAYNNITLKDAAGNTVTIAKSISGDTLTLTPSGSYWTVGTSYTVTIPANAVKNNMGPGTNINQTYTFSFNTGTASSLDDVMGGTVGIGDMIKYGKYGGKDLTWYYMGGGNFIMTKDCSETLNLERRFDDNFNGWASAELNLWLNNTTDGFIQKAFDNDPMIAYVTIPSVDQYDELASVCRGEGTYTKGWWLRSTTNTLNYYYSGSQTYYVKTDGAVVITGVATTGIRVRPVFRLKAEIGGGGLTISSGGSGMTIYTVAAGKPFQVLVPGEFGSSTGIKMSVIPKGGTAVANAIVAVTDTGDGFTLVKNDPVSKPNGFSAGIKFIDVNGKKVVLNVVDALGSTPTPSTVGTINFGI